MKVAVAWQAASEECELIREILPDTCVVEAAPQRPRVGRYEADPNDVVALCREAEAVMGWVVPRRALAESPSLRFLSWMHAGCDKLDLDLLQSRGIQVANVRGANDVAVAEQAMTFVLALAKRLLSNHQAVLEVRWQPQWDPGYVSRELADSTLAVIGLGAVGKQVALRAKAFGMHVLGVRRHPDRDLHGADEVIGPDALPTVLGRADFVVLCLPLTADTDGYFGETALRQMRRDAYLINVARGGIVAEPALHRALTEGWIAGFATDVWWDYPEAMPSSMHFNVPSRMGIQRLPGVVASGDCAANAFAVRDRMIRCGAENIAAYARGERPVHLVDLSLGY